MPSMASDGSTRFRLMLTFLSLTLALASCRDATQRSWEASPVPAETSGSLTVTSPSDSPGRLVFASDRDGRYAIYAVDGDGSALQQLTNRPRHDYAPAWSPSGDQVAFVETEYLPYAPDATRPTPRSLFVMRSDGSELRLLTDQASRTYDRPVWSPDGARIALQCSHEPSDPKGEDSGQICVVDVGEAGGQVRRLLPASLFGTLGSWSPDGQQIAFWGFSWPSPDDSGLYTVELASGVVRRLGDEPSHDRGSISWSPDGLRIAYARAGQDDGRLTLIDADGSDAKQVDLAGLRPRSVVWSPTGEQLAFSAQPAGSTDPTAAIYAIDADGTNLRQITGTEWVGGELAWSADGQKIAFVTS